MTRVLEMLVLDGVNKRSIEGSGSFLVGCGWFCLGGAGEGKRKLQGTFIMVVFSLDDASIRTSLFMLYIIY
jgi:hypothetical protein